jgi:hypothetical protein
MERAESPGQAREGGANNGPLFSRRGPPVANPQ